MPPRKYTDDQIAEAAELREGGMSHAAIARKVGMSIGAVSWHCLRLGADSPRTRGKVPEQRGPMICNRSGHNVRKFTAEEDATSMKLDLDGATTAAIARTLGRRWNSTRGRQMTLARHAARREEVGDDDV